MSTRQYKSHHYEKADKARAKKDYETCARFCKAILKKNPRDYAALELWAVSALECLKLGDAARLGLELAEKAPQNPNGAMVASVAFMNASEDQNAIDVLERQLLVTPDVMGLWFNLYSAYSSMGDNQKALEIALKTVEKDPINPDAYNNLGSCLTSLGRASDAVIAFKTAVDLNPEHATAKLNLLATDVISDSERIARTEEILATSASKSIPERSLIGAVHNAAFSYLRLGRLEEGWLGLEKGLSPLIDSNRGRRPQRTFREARRWLGEDIRGKKLLVWREQGVGDEIMFYSVLHELGDIAATVIVECDKRLIPILQRSFPNFSIRPELYRAIYPHDSPKEDFDYHIPVGSLCGLYRKSLESFKRRPPSYLAPPPDKLEEVRDRFLKATNASHFVGLCWRSAISSPTRGPSYTVLEDWLALFDSSDVAVVNLQYGQTEDEILEFEKRFGKRLFRWRDYDLQDDFDVVAAIISNLTAVFSVATTVAQLAGAVGKKTYMPATGYAWTSFGTKGYPFHPATQLCVGETMVGSVSMAIDSFFGDINVSRGTNP